MAEHLTDEQQEEQIKQWIKDNWFSIVAGLVLGFTGLFGWRYYQAEQQAYAEAASSVYQQLTSSLARADNKGTLTAADTLLQDFKDTPYAAYAAMAKARVALESGKAEEARTQYEWVMSHSDAVAVQNIARLRLGRLLLSEGQLDNAMSLIAAAKGSSFTADFAELKGDIFQEKGDIESARAAYTEALKALPDDAQAPRAIIETKLNDIAPASPTAEATS